MGSDRRTVYVASSFGLKDRIEAVYRELLNAGHRVPDVWWNENVKTMDLPDAEWYDHPEVRAMADRHWKNIEYADTFVLVCPPDEPKKYNGANIEFGYALATGCECYAVGALERSAMYQPIHRVDTIAALIDELGVADTDTARTAVDGGGGGDE